MSYTSSLELFEMTVLLEAPIQIIVPDTYSAMTRDETLSYALNRYEP